MQPKLFRIVGARAKNVWMLKLESKLLDS